MSWVSTLLGYSGTRAMIELRVTDPRSLRMPVQLTVASTRTRPDSTVAGTKLLSSREKVTEPVAPGTEAVGDKDAVGLLAAAGSGGRVARPTLPPRPSSFSH